jgi:hypothetical protein
MLYFSFTLRTLATRPIILGFDPNPKPKVEGIVGYVSKNIPKKEYPKMII